MKLIVCFQTISTLISTLWTTWSSSTLSSKRCRRRKNRQPPTTFNTQSTTIEQRQRRYITTTTWRRLITINNSNNNNSSSSSSNNNNNNNRPKCRCFSRTTSLRSSSAIGPDKRRSKIRTARSRCRQTCTEIRCPVKSRHRNSVGVVASDVQRRSIRKWVDTCCRSTTERRFNIWVEPSNVLCADSEGSVVIWRCTSRPSITKSSIWAELKLWPPPETTTTIHPTTTTTEITAVTSWTTMQPGKVMFRSSLFTRTTLTMSTTSTTALSSKSTIFRSRPKSHIPPNQVSCRRMWSRQNRWNRRPPSMPQKNRIPEICFSQHRLPTDLQYLPMLLSSQTIITGSVKKNLLLSSCI